MKNKIGARTTSGWGICAVGFAVGALACSTDGQLNIGENFGSQLSDYSATWDGYVENGMFDDGSDRVRLTLDANGNGTLRLGDRPLYPDPTDPNVGWPNESISLYGGSLVVTGFEYPVFDTRIEAKRIRLGADPPVQYRQWCSLQTPLLDEVNTDTPIYNCIPNWGTWEDRMYGLDCGLIHPVTGERMPIDCAKLFLCRNVCRCDASGCTAPSHEPGERGRSLDAAIEGPEGNLVGSLSFSQTGGNVRLARQ